MQSLPSITLSSGQLAVTAFSRCRMFTRAHSRLAKPALTPRQTRVLEKTPLEVWAAAVGPLSLSAPVSVRKDAWYLEGN